MLYEVITKKRQVQGARGVQGRRAFHMRKDLNCSQRRRGWHFFSGLAPKRKSPGEPGLLNSWWWAMKDLNLRLPPCEDGTLIV